MKKIFNSKKTFFSVVVPVYNEEESLPFLVEKIDDVFLKMDSSYELIFIDDGSTDESVPVLIELLKKYKQIKILEQRRNFGKAIALNEGFKVAAGDVVITMDGDLQDDPKEIPSMLEKLNEGYDLISGWKKKRFDPWHKTMPSKLFNFVTSKISGVRLHDFNCGFKMYRSEVVKSMNIYGEMHRYIPAIAHWKGFSSAEIPVEHHARKYGKSKYGIKRFLRGLFDFLTIAFITKYISRPMHFFGKFGIVMLFVGIGIGLYLTVLWTMREFFGYINIGPLGTRPLLSLSVLLILVGMLFFGTGLISEMIVYLNRNRDVDGHVVRTSHGISENKK